MLFEFVTFNNFIIIKNNIKIILQVKIIGCYYLFIFLHWCPSGLRGATQVRMASASWVRTPPNV